MKNKFLAAVMAAALVLLPLGMNTIEASAEEPTTFAVKFVEEKDEWRFMSGTSTFDDGAYHRELYYLYEQIKDGDIVVVYNDSDNADDLNLGSTRLSNLTVASTTDFTVIYSGKVDLFFALEGTASAINAPYIDTANVYDEVVCNFNGNIGTLNFYLDGEIESTIGCSGTVAHLYGYSPSEERTYYDYYDFKKDTLAIYNGGFQTPNGAFSYTPTAATPAPATPAPSAPGSASTGSDYDDVPKTGESSAAMWLLFTAALCAGGSYVLGKKAQ